MSRHFTHVREIKKINDDDDREIRLDVCKTRILSCFQRIDQEDWGKNGWGGRGATVFCPIINVSLVSLNKKIQSNKVRRLSLRLLKEKVSYFKSEEHRFFWVYSMGVGVGVMVV